LGDKDRSISGGGLRAGFDKFPEVEFPGVGGERWCHKLGEKKSGGSLARTKQKQKGQFDQMRPRWKLIGMKPHVRGKGKKVGASEGKVESRRSKWGEERSSSRQKNKTGEKKIKKAFPGGKGLSSSRLKGPCELT